MVKGAAEALNGDGNALRGDRVGLKIDLVWI